MACFKPLYYTGNSIAAAENTFYKIRGEKRIEVYTYRMAGVAPSLLAKKHSVGTEGSNHSGVQEYLILPFRARLPDPVRA